MNTGDTKYFLVFYSEEYGKENHSIHNTLDDAENALKNICYSINNSIPVL
jgi:hypothetical protein